MTPRFFFIVGLLASLTTASIVRAQSNHDEVSLQLERLLEQSFTESAGGCAVGIVRNGKTISQAARGLASVEHQVQIDSRSAFYLASVTKSFTAALVLMTVLDGKLSLDDPVGKYLTAFSKFPDLLVGNLLYQESGVRDYLDLWYLSTGQNAAGPETSSSQIEELLSRQENLSFPPGSSFQYADANFFLLGQILVNVTGKSIKEYAQEKIFGTLGMSNTHYHDTRSHVITNRARGYYEWEGEAFATYTEDNFILGGVGVYSNIDDLVLWIRELDTRKVFTQEFYEMWSSEKPLTNGKINRWIPGRFRGTRRGYEREMVTGVFGSFKSSVVHYPEQRVGSIVLCNNGLSYQSQFELESAVEDISLGAERNLRSDQDWLEGIEKETVIEHRISQSHSFQNHRFFSNELNVEWRVSVESQQMTIETPFQRTFRLTQLSDTTYKSGILEVVILEDGQLIVNTQRAQGIVFKLLDEES